MKCQICKEREVHDSFETPEGEIHLCHDCIIDYIVFIAKDGEDEVEDKSIVDSNFYRWN
jgi:hypothetical protein